MEKKKKRWLGDPPRKCQICEKPMTTAFVDGRTIFGPWAFMCETCHPNAGIGLGIGKGQKYSLPDGELIEGGSQR